MSKAINDADFESEVVKASLPVVIDFWAPWCGPCKAMGPIIDELSKEMEGKVSFVKMNVDENIDTPRKIQRDEHPYLRRLQKWRSSTHIRRSKIQGRF
jgi:thioredoxin